MQLITVVDEPVNVARHWRGSYEQQAAPIRQTKLRVNASVCLFQQHNDIRRPCVSADLYEACRRERDINSLNKLKYFQRRSHCFPATWMSADKKILVFPRR